MSGVRGRKGWQVRKSQTERVKQRQAGSVADKDDKPGDSNTIMDHYGTAARW